MRFSFLTLTRYGSIENRTVEFPRKDGVDIHIIYGPNEAGKSTISNAIIEFMFGIQERTPMGFRFPANTLEIAGGIEHGDASASLIRYKRRKTPLTDTVGAAFSDAQMSEFVGTINPDIFKRAWCLTHSRMVSGGTEILQAKDDASRMIFQAAAGLDGIEKLTQAYQEEADKLWSARRGGDRAYWSGESRLKEAEDDLKSALVRGKAWSEATTRQTTAAEALEAARTALADDAHRRTLLERVRRVAPHLQKLHQVSIQIDELAHAPLLPEDAEELLRKVEQRLASTAQTIVNETARREAADQDMKAAPLDARALAMEQDITGLGVQRASVARHVVDVSKRSQEADALEAAALRDAARLRLAAGDVAALRMTLPGAELRKALATQAAAYTGKSSNLTATRAAEIEDNDKLEQLRKQIADVPPTTEPAALSGAAEGLRAQGQVEDLRSQHEARETKATLNLEEALRRLLPWSGSIHALRELIAFPAEEAGTLLSRLRAIENDLRDHRSRLLEAQRVRDEAKTTADQALLQAGPIAPEQLAAARAVREGLWIDIKRGAPVADTSAAYEGSVFKADAIADQRFTGAASVHALTAARDVAEKADRAVQDREALIGNAMASLEEINARWTAIAGAAGVPALEMSNATSWLAARDTGLRAGVDVDHAVADLAGFDRRVEEQASMLWNALEVAGVAISSPSTASILLAAADAHVSRQREGVIEHKRLSKAIVEAEENARSAAKRSSAAQAELAEWERAWSALLGRAGLPPDTTSDSALLALEALNEIGGQLKSADELRVRVAAMKEDLQGFECNADRLRDLLGLPANQTPDEIAKTAAERLETAHRAQRLHDGARQRKADAQKAIDTETAQQAEARALLAPLLSASRCEAAHDLRRAIQVSVRKRTLQAEADAIRNALLEAAGGLSFEAAASEVHSVDIPTVEIEIQALAEKQHQLQDERERQVVALNEAHQQLKSMQGGDAAALAEGRRQEAVADMARAAERYIRLRITTRLLAWSVNRFREERQDPLLRLAGTRFAALTGSSFTGLAIDYEGQNPVIKGLRPGGELVGVEGMSDGTRDQLYLALRIAAIEQHLDKTHALPFIADDLFINFDEGRVESGLRALEPLASRSQVIYFTHHRHVVDAARAVYGENISVTAL